MFSAPNAQICFVCNFFPWAGGKHKINRNFLDENFLTSPILNLINFCFYNIFHTNINSFARKCMEWGYTLEGL